MNDLIVYKDNYLVEASYKLTLMEQRLMLYCISKLNPQKPQQKQKIVVEDFIKQFPDIQSNNAYAQIKKSIDALGERWIKVKDPKYIEEFRWIQSKKYFNNTGTAVIEFSNSVMPYLCQLEKQFTNYLLRNISAFKRTYSIRLYELLTQYRT
ncbi:replication initiation protein, partial [Gilliamella sp. CG16]|uniref:replication initiation protein n=1 Tax=Gilliamella sp. CG16 TaxID=3351503 RepID=UPI0039871EDF